MKKVLQRGFTLIELLVVIAIIGILAAVVLASLNDARSSGSDAAIKQSLGNARSQAEIVYNKNGAFSYATVCADSQIDKLVLAARDAAGLTAAVNETDATASSATTPTCRDDASSWGIAAPLASNTAISWCVDGTGQAGLATSTTALAASPAAGAIRCTLIP